MLAIVDGGERKEERTKFPTIKQYKNCSAPTTTKNARKVSNSLIRCGVFFK